MSVQDVLDAMELGIQADGANLVKKVNGIIVYQIGSNAWTLDLKTGEGKITKGASPSADLTVTVGEEDFVMMGEGKLNPQQAFLKGKLKLKGNMALAMKLGSVIESARKAAAAGGGGGGGGGGAKAAPAAPAAAAAAAGGGVGGAALKSAPVFDQIREALKVQGAELVKAVNGVIQFNVAPGGVFVVDLKNGTGSVSTTAASKADITISVSDEDMSLLAEGKLNPQQAFLKGKIKLQGNMALAMKLGKVFDTVRPKAKL